MPNKPPRILKCGCRVPSGHSCRHQRIDERHRQRELDARRPGTAQRGYDAEWQRESRSFLSEPANRHCACGALATMVAHIISINQAPHMRMKRSNWKPSCTPCNLRQNIACEGGFGNPRRLQTGGGSIVSKNPS
ncbi:endonuclease [Tardiphaga alba]|uniref:Endonuclease n=1 Tax=Tardiphaga alba TaxID=340268 RepID=A0ABX8A5R6_9BRAD|nr:endonuclease [Tardiphaga alba]